MFEGRCQSRGSCCELLEHRCASGFAQPRRPPQRQWISYAKSEGALGAYFMWGLQENYTPEYIWQFMEDHDDIEYLSYEDGLAGEESMEETLVRIEELLGSHYAIELDVDVIAEFPSSAQSISGFSLEQVRKMIYSLDTNPTYFHLCEGRIASADDAARAGRGLALLVADFIKAFIFQE
jgi:formiminoglutamase